MKLMFQASEVCRSRVVECIDEVCLHFLPAELVKTRQLIFYQLRW